MTGGPNAEQAEFWNSAASRYWVTRAADFDAINRELTERLLAACAPEAGEQTLDIGCGGGTTSFALADAVGPEGSVLGLDISEPLLSLAETRRQGRGDANVAFQLGDAEVHRFEPAGRDLVISRFGVMFFADPVAAFRNIGAALRPGGRMVFVAWGGPEANPFFALPQAAAAARLGPLPDVPPEAPGPMAFRDPARVAGLLRAAGLAEVRAEPTDVDLHHPGGVEAMVALTTSVGPVSRALRETGGTEADRAAIAEALRTAFAPFATPDGIRVPARVIYYFAARP